MVAYCTAEDVRNFSLPTGIVADDTRVTAMCEAASRVVDGYTRRTFSISATGTQTIYGVSDYVSLPDPFTAITAVTVNGVATTDYEIGQYGISLGRYSAYSTYPSGYSNATVTVSATFGYSAVPDVVKQATALIAKSLLLPSESVPSTATDAGGNVAVLPEVAARAGDGSNAPNSWGVTPIVLDTTGDITADRLLQPYRLVVLA